jgi:hypothetical protein
MFVISVFWDAALQRQQIGYGIAVVASPLGARGSRPSGRRAT